MSLLSGISFMGLGGSFSRAFAYAHWSLLISSGHCIPWDGGEVDDAVGLNSMTVNFNVRRKIYIWWILLRRITVNFEVNVVTENHCEP